MFIEAEVQLACGLPVSNAFSYLVVHRVQPLGWHLNQRNLMNIKLATIAILLAPFACIYAGSPDEKAFVDKYKTAFEAKDNATLESFLYTTGSDPMALEFYKMMMSGEAGSKISKIELVALTPDE